jgi:palmitoyltransferase
MKQSESFFVSSLFQNDLATAYRLLRSGSVDLLSVRDPKDYTLLHLAALNNQSAAISFLLKYGADFCSERSVLDWVNESSGEGFTCLHLAAFRGNLVRSTQHAIKLLIEHGADIHKLSHQGLSVVHVAAQGDQPLVVAFFYSLGLPCDDVDFRGGTPLHWAAYLSAEQTTNLLLAWKVDLDQQDADLHTPLHLATLTDNSRIVRNLLLSGASRHLTDKEGRTPRDIAVQIGSSRIEELLKSPSLCSSTLGLKTPLRPYRSNRLILLVYLVLFSCVFAVNRLLVASRLAESFYSSALLYTFTIVSLTSLVTFVVVAVKDPGYLRPEAELSVLVRPRQELYENYDSGSICPECKLVKPYRSRHCQCCNRCVAKFDHHCPWINNCVGGGNLGCFYLYVTSTWLAVLTAALLGLLFLSNEGLDLSDPLQVVVVFLVLAEFSASLPLM